MDGGGKKGNDDKHQKTARGRVGTRGTLKHSFPFSTPNQFFALRNIKFLMLNENLARSTFSLVHFSISEIVRGEKKRSRGESVKEWRQIFRNAMFMVIGKAQIFISEQLKIEFWVEI